MSKGIDKEIKNQKKEETFEYIKTARKRPPLTKEMMRIIGLPESLDGAVKKELEANSRRVFDTFKKYFEGGASPLFVLFQGREKSGKSSALAVLAKLVKVKSDSMNKSAYYITVPNLKENISLKKNFDGSTDYYEKCILTDCLFLDELSEEGYNEYFMEKLSSIIRNRLSENKPTFIATELKPDDLFEFYKKHPPLVKYLKRFRVVELKGSAK